VFEVESWEECKKSCSQLNDVDNKKKCIAFVTTKKHQKSEKTVCMLYRDAVLEQYDYPKKKGYLYYDKNAVKVFDQKDMPKDVNRFKGKTQIPMTRPQTLCFQLYTHLLYEFYHCLYQYPHTLYKEVYLY
jgi:hypothetical protein